MREMSISQKYKYFYIYIYIYILVKRGAVRANDLPLSNDVEEWPDSSVGRAPTYKVRGREFESRSGRLFSRTVTFHFFQTLLLLLNCPQLYPVDGAVMAPWCEQSSLNSRSNAHCDGAAMAPLCKLVMRGAV